MATKDTVVLSKGCGEWDSSGLDWDMGWDHLGF